MQVRSWVWVLFALMVLALLAVDLGLFRASRRAPQEVALRSAAWWSAAWIGLSLVFGLVILVLYGSAPALTYLTAYLLEKSLSVDNIFVFVLIFSELRIPPAQQRRVLYWERTLGTRSRGSACRLACTILQSPALKNASRSALTWSLCVEGKPCGAPG